MGMLDGRPQWPLRSRDTPVVVLAHRGGEGPEPENSLAAFARALGAGADGVELDVRLSADGVPVVHHDALLPDGAAVSELAASALPDHVPTLEQALATCAGAVVDVEIKNSPGEPGHDPSEALAVLVAAMVGARAGAPGGPAAAIVTSFWPATLAAVRTAEAAVATGLLVHPALDPLAGLGQAADLGCTALLPFVARFDAALCDAAHGQGLAVVVWTVNDDAGLRAAERAGADAVVSDKVALALEVLGRR